MSTPETLIQEIDRLKFQHYWSEGRCSGHGQFNGRYCRDAAGPERWCINCAGYVQEQQLRAAKAEILRQQREIARLRCSVIAADHDPRSLVGD
jgi:hypothetical protein